MRRGGTDKIGKTIDNRREKRYYKKQEASYWRKEDCVMKMKNIVFSFDVDPLLREGIERIKKMLGFSEGDGIAVTAVAGERTGVSLCEGRAIIYYTKKHLFFRELGVLVEQAAK